MTRKKTKMKKVSNFQSKKNYITNRSLSVLFLTRGFVFSRENSLSSLSCWFEFFFHSQTRTRAFFLIYCTCHIVYTLSPTKFLIINPSSLFLKWPFDQTIISGICLFLFNSLLLSLGFCYF